MTQLYGGICFRITANLHHRQTDVYKRQAVIDAGGAKREVSSQLLEDLEPGDYVMVHAGVAIAKITDEDDSETDQLMEEFL